MTTPPYPLHQPSTEEELATIVREASSLTFGAGRSPLFCGANEFTDTQRAHIAARRDIDAPDQVEATATRLNETTHLDFTNLAGIREYHPADQVVVVGAGTLIGGWSNQPDRLQTVLAGEGQCLPLPYLEADAAPLLQGWNTTVGLGIARNLPHAAEYGMGNWRDWVLGMTLVLADGTITRTGSKVVKSVAGYDVHRLMIGAFDTLAVVAEVTLRTCPIAAKKTTSIVTTGTYEPKRPVTVQHVRRTDLKAACDHVGELLIAFEPEAGLLWFHSEEGSLPRRWPHDVVRLSHPPTESWHPAVNERLWEQAKAKFDPSNKLNPSTRPK